MTGDDLSTSLLAGQALILGGLGLIVATRRRRPRRA
ncbi:LPXTG cell wall anchor domain-containing protein [Amorphoplanes digitatis]|uniref:LPXTG-motif cell wall-anchored protein n=1 Tax=Actinoplanes digitatis TaxID=1868 RepID=A0A7W7HWM0_9ACTN|nr:LPXTG cell wall anchor domain-containing protein [Actinoplanes digitatis]MBB4762148.1 LPXTG-motif cell wall-anchored protein [Actinoplanes digitatis]